jgi:hypothetical protein
VVADGDPVLGVYRFTSVGSKSTMSPPMWWRSRVFEAARQRDQPATMHLVGAVIAELASHPPVLRGPTVMGQTKKRRYVPASAWQSSIAASRHRARR